MESIIIIKPTNGDTGKETLAKQNEAGINYISKFSCKQYIKFGA